ncbi:VirB8/TrbF family protein [Nocardia sp. NBC_01327]|uniref:VirB8/TrbF family protein n=1 Tax=Nocardia sp. NBC_01327 TaxID=2903593 RepID=UPI002E0F4850|nr:VirB8/TrbF family protein [Nocardia sp. NBC_01327]
MSTPDDVPQPHSVSPQSQPQPQQGPIVQHQIQQQPMAISQPPYSAQPQAYSMPPPVAPRSRAATMIPVISAALAVLCVAIAVTFFVMYTQEHHTAQERAGTIDQMRQQVSDVDAREVTARRAACDYATAMSTYSYTDLDPYFKAVLNGSTGSWHQNFSESSTGLRPAMVQAQVRSSVTDVHCGVSSLTAHDAEVLVSAKQTRATATNPTPGATVVPMLMTLQEQSDGRWLVSDIKTLFG